MSDADTSRELRLDRLLRAPRSAVWRCWTEPELIVQWFTPPPWKTIRADMDVRPGGSTVIVMQGPEGQEVPNPGVFLDVVPGQRLIFTDAFVSAWEPSGKAFMVADLTMADEDGGTRYKVRVSHWTNEDRAAHEAMGFHQGWGIATDQLEALAASVGG